jgi:hypothetical protein
MSPTRNETVPLDGLTDKIRERAYEIWEASGRQEGRHREHWLQAERELRTPSSGAERRETKSDHADPTPSRQRKPRAKGTPKRKAP